MPVSERQAQNAVAHTLGARSGDGVSPTTRAAGLTPTAAWSRRVRWIGGLIQAAFAAFWLVRGSAVTLLDSNGRRSKLEPGGWEHFARND